MDNLDSIEAILSSQPENATDSTTAHIVEPRLDNEIIRADVNDPIVLAAVATIGVFAAGLFWLNERDSKQ